METTGEESPLRGGRTLRVWNTRQEKPRKGVKRGAEAASGQSPLLTEKATAPKLLPPNQIITERSPNKPLPNSPGYAPEPPSLALRLLGATGAGLRIHVMVRSLCGAGRLAPPRGIAELLLLVVFGIWCWVGGVKRFRRGSLAGGLNGALRGAPLRPKLVAVRAQRSRGGGGGKMVFGSDPPLGGLSGFGGLAGENLNVSVVVVGGGGARMSSPCLKFIQLPGHMSLEICPIDITMVN